MAETTPTILLVEDNMDNRIIYSTMLNAVGYRVIDAGDGEAGVAMAVAERPDLILMDISLPVMDGYQAMAALRANPDTAGIPIIALTAHAMAEDRARALDAGADAYLAKPIEPRAVADEVRRMLDNPPRR